LREVAAEAGVSIGTVSNALNSPQKLAPETLRRVRRAIDLLGFSRNDAARTLASGSGTGLGLVVPTFRNSLMVDIAEGAQRAARAEGLRLQLVNADSDDAAIEADIDLLLNGRVSGMLIAPMTDSRTEVDRVRRLGIPVVLVNYEVPSRDACSVVVDNELAGFMAAKHLIDLGHRRIVLVGGCYHFQPTALRREGARAAVRQAGSRVTLEEHDAGGIAAAHGTAVAGTFPGRVGRATPDAVLALTDALANGITTELVNRGASIPDDIAVMGCDCNAFASTGPVPLSSVELRGSEMGKEAVRLLVDELSDQAHHEHETIRLRPRLVTRESTVGPTSGPSTRSLGHLTLSA
jgi:LacI family transcriptional regulator